MDAVHHDVFSKFKPVKKLSTRQEADGREVQVHIKNYLQVLNYTTLPYLITRSKSEKTKNSL